MTIRPVSISKLITKRDRAFYKAGADAMLAALRKTGHRSDVWDDVERRFRDAGGTVVFIPDDLP